MKAHFRTLALAVASALSTANAQQAADRSERIEVTGTRIPSSDAESASPVVMIRADEIRTDGTAAIEHVLNNLPQFHGDQSSRVSNDATGTATANLRGLGPARTLVLVNGRRLPMGNPSFGLAPDLNQIPAPLVSRIEILTGGASAVYGSDAIAGVVNFILNDRFQGVQGDVTHEFYGHRQKSPIADLVRARNFEVPADKSHDGETSAVGLTLGRNFAAGRGNATAFLGYLKSEALLQSERDYSACALNVSDDGSLFCGGSNTGHPGRFVDLSSRARPRPLWTVADEAGNVRPWSEATDTYNFAPFNYYQRPQERYSLYASAGYDFTPDARIYAEFGYHDDRTSAQIAPSGSFNLTVPVRYENPLLSADWRSRLVFRTPAGAVGTGPGTTSLVIIARRNVEGGSRDEILRHTSYRQIVGFRGAVAGWDYDVFGQVARVSFEEAYLRDFSITRTYRALDVVTDPATGNPVCRSVLDGSDRTCVPWNIWRLGGVTPQSVAYLEMPATQRGSTSLRAAGASLTGALGRYGIRVPGAPNDAEAALGFERRVEELSFEPDSAHTSGDLAGHILATPPLRASSAVNEVFAELRLPVRNGVHVGGSFRHSAYASGQETDTFGLGFNAGGRVARVRGSYQQAIRAANLRELFDPRVEGNYGIFRPDGTFLGDPCSGPTPVRSPAECARTGVTPAQYGSIPDSPTSPFGFPALFGGDPRVAPETAKTITMGMVLTPVRDLSVTLDYFDIRLHDTIGRVEPLETLTQCLDTGEARFCERVRRDPVFGSLWLQSAFVDGTNQNVGRTRVEGVDVALDYRHRVTKGHVVGVDVLGTYLHRWSTEAFIGAGAVECAGRFHGSCGAPKPTWRHKARVTWRTPWRFEVAATWRYVRAVTEDWPTDPVKAPSASYLDLAGTWRFDERTTVRAGVSNVADRDPPVIPLGTGVFNGNTYVGIYDPLGRRVFLALTAKFK